MKDLIEIAPPKLQEELETAMDHLLNPYLEKIYEERKAKEALAKQIAEEQRIAKEQRKKAEEQEAKLFETVRTLLFDMEFSMKKVSEITHLSLKTIKAWKKRMGE